MIKLFFFESLLFLLMNVSIFQISENILINAKEYDSYFQFLVFIDLYEDDQQVEKEVLFWNLSYDSCHNNLEIIRGRPFAWGSSKSRNMNIELFSKAMEYDSLGNWVFKGKIQLIGPCIENNFDVLGEQIILDKEIQINFSKREIMDVAKRIDDFKPIKLVYEASFIDVECNNSLYEVKMNSFIVKSYSNINPWTNLLIDPKLVQY